ncbi:hypothetical protein KLP40_12230 [Hymenobacter sp. NST-14]|uniref:hypothetical protein n=1 Tax=Hymenobacter piscis TaxID=2839984 RepID=UPI001C028B97|nr:hypothetical protein [Hymenobacter piscis]MBT9393932.1 hypothetical protein [Hymenobacter piscis]
MELDDFRRQWQQQPVGSSTDTLTSEQTLRAMLTAHTSANPLIRLKKNAVRELQFVLMGLVLIVFDALIFFRHVAKMQLFAAGIFLVICLVGLIVYRRLQLIRQMEGQQGNLYHLLQTRISRFRQLMRLHDWVGVGALFCLYVFVGVVRWEYVRAYLAPGQPGWGGHLAAAAGGLLLLLALLYAAYRTGRREHQRRYGRYLDQLEAALSELRA